MSGLQTQLDEIKRRFIATVPPEAVAVVLGATQEPVRSGIDLHVYNGDDSWELPMPGTFVGCSRSDHSACMRQC